MATLSKRLFSAAARNVGAVLADSATFSTRDAFRLPKSHLIWSFGDLNAYSSAFAAGFHEAGLCKGHKLVMQVAPTSAEAVVAQLAASRLGAEVVVVGTDVEAEGLSKVLESTKPTMFICDAGTSGEKLFASEVNTLSDGRLTGAAFYSSQVPSLRCVATTSLEPARVGLTNFKNLPVYGRRATYDVHHAEADVTPDAKAFQVGGLCVSQKQLLEAAGRVQSDFSLGPGSYVAVRGEGAADAHVTISVAVMAALRSQGVVLVTDDIEAAISGYQAKELDLNGAKKTLS